MSDEKGSLESDLQDLLSQKEELDVRLKEAERERLAMIDKLNKEELEKINKILSE